MPLRDVPIQRKLMLVILVTSVVVMLLMRGSFFTYEYLTFRQATIRQLSTLGEIIATNSTAALAFENHEDAKEILAALKAERNVVAAALYDQSGGLFAQYPDGLPAGMLPVAPTQDGYRFVDSELIGVQPVVQKDRRLGSLYLKLDTGIIMRQWLWDSLRIGLAVMAVVLVVAYVISKSLQKQISQPILALKETAQAVSERGDYSVRAHKLGNDELGMLTNSFNQMLEQIQSQNQTLEQNELQLQTIIENLDEGLAVSDLTGQILHFNRTALVLHEFSSPDECHRHLTQFAQIFEISTLDGTVVPIDQWPLARILKGDRINNLELRIRRIQSDWQRIFNYGGTLVHTPDGKPMMAVVTISDITERKRAAEEILQLNTTLERRVSERTAQLEAANKELESFSYSVSHDLRAPLRHVQGYVEMLREEVEGQLTDTTRRYLKVIGDAAREMGNLIDNLLAFSRMGRTEMREAVVDLNQLIREVREMPELDTHGRTINWTTASLTPVHGDAALLRQVLVNLLGNAIKYTRQRDPAEIEIGCAGKEDGRTIFFVRDNGAGFDMKYAGKLFGVFQRLHRADEFEGTGIGLASVQRIIARHGGRIWAESQVNAGATFYFTLLPAKAGAP